MPYIITLLIEEVNWLWNYQTIPLVHW